MAALDRSEMAALDRSAEEEIYRLCAATPDVTQLNIAKGSEFVVNTRGEKLHVRTYWPAVGAAKAVIINLHGYSSHTNRPTQKYISSKFLSKGFAYICLDFHGHGYSEGVKGLVTSAENLIDDVLSLLVALYSRIFHEFHGEETDPVRRFHLNNYSLNIPFFLLGQSMGGSTALIVGDLLSYYAQEDKQLRSIANNFEGCIFLCPAISIKVPPPTVVKVLDRFIVPLFGRASIPKYIKPSNSNADQVWKNADFIAYVERDGYPLNPKGLSYNHPIRFQTGSTILKLAAKCQDVAVEVNYPFLVFHDPDDKVVQYKGALKLMKESQTEGSDKKLILIEGGMHDLLTNEMTFTVEKTIEWVEARLLIEKKQNSFMKLSIDEQQEVSLIK